MSVTKIHAPNFLSLSRLYYHSQSQVSGWDNPPLKTYDMLLKDY